MNEGVHLEGVYAPSEDVVAREIEGELIIVPLAAGIGDMEDELYTMNETGKAIWDRLDGTTTLRDLARALAGEYEAPLSQIEQDILGLLAELLRRRMVVAVSQP